MLPVPSQSPSHGSACGSQRTLRGVAALENTGFSAWMTNFVVADIIIVGPNPTKSERGQNHDDVGTVGKSTISSLGSCRRGDRRKDPVVRRARRPVARRNPFGPRKEPI